MQSSSLPDDIVLGDPPSHIQLQSGSNITISA